MSLALAKTGSSFVPLPGTAFVTENCGTKVLNVDHVCLLTTVLTTVLLLSSVMYLIQHIP